MLTIEPDARRATRPTRPGRSTAEYGRLRRDDRLADQLTVADGMEKVAASGEASRHVSRRPIASPALERATITTVELDYLISRREDGIVDVAAMLRGNDAHLAIRENRQPISPRRGFDKTKPARAAAFAGIATLSEVSA